VKLLLLALAACGSDPVATPDATPCADAALCAGACPAVFSGNFADHSLEATNCATFDPTLAMSITSPLIGSPLAISLDLGPAPSPGPYSSEFVPTWSAVQARSIGNGACVYSAGDQVVPLGSFTLNLSDATTPHGTLELELTVHAVDGTVCGAGDLESVSIVF
jgi:hypothetical protein